MADFGTTDFTVITNAMLDYHIRGKSLAQTIQDKPLLSWLRSNQETFPGGLNTDGITMPVHGAFMSDTAGYMQGYSGDEQLLFKGSTGLLRAKANWYELHMGLAIDHTTLKKDGISVTEGTIKEHSKKELTQLTSVLKHILDDYTESNMRAMNQMLWDDGSLGAKYVPGVASMFNKDADPAAATICGLSGATYPWWRFRKLAGATKITSSPTNQTLTKTLRSEIRQLRRFGGKVNKLFCGSKFIELLEAELFEKGVYTQDGFRNEGKNDIGMATIRMSGVGTFDYDPTMDDLGMANFAYFMDSRRLKLQVMEGEDMRQVSPSRPHDYLVFLKSVLWTGGLITNQPNAFGVYEAA